MNQDTFEKNTNEKPKYDFEELKAEHKAHILGREVGGLFCTILFIIQQLTGNELADSAEALALLCLLDTILVFELCKFKPKRKKYLIFAILDTFLFLHIMATWLWSNFGK